MSTRSTLKGYFKKGYIPTESQFAELIDSTLNFEEDPILKASGGPLSIKANGTEETLLNFYRVEQGRNSLTWQIKQKSSDKAGLNIATSEGTSRLYIDSATGRLGVATTSPQSQLAVAGGLAVGAGYAGTKAAPTNGLLVEGTVGIGTDNPGSKLTVKADGNAGKDTDSGLTAGGQIAIKGNAPQIDFIDTDNKDWAIHVNSNKMYFIREPWEHTDLVLDGTGKVGIGTVSPISKLSVAGGLSIGSNYAGANAAPTNGLLVEGSVGVGVSPAAGSALHVNGTVRVENSNGYAEFNGTNSHLVLPAMTLDFSSGFTVEVWVNFRSFNTFSRIIDLGNGEGADNIVLCNETFINTLRFHSNVGGVANQLINVRNALELNTWTHIAATVDKDGIAIIYKNGVMIGGSKLSTPTSVNRTKNYIGRSNWSSDGYFDGQMRELRIWTVARTQAQINETLFSRLTGQVTGLAACYPLDSANQGQDVAGKGFNGTLSNLSFSTGTAGNIVSIGQNGIYATGGEANQNLILAAKGKGNVYVPGKLITGNSWGERYGNGQVTTTSTTWVDIPDMKFDILAGNRPMYINLTISEAWAKPDVYVYYQLLLDSSVIASMSNHYVSRHSSICLQRLTVVSEGLHTLKAQWKVSGSEGASNASRCLVAFEL